MVMKHLVVPINFRSAAKMTATREQDAPTTAVFYLELLKTTGSPLS